MKKKIKLKKISVLALISFCIIFLTSCSIADRQQESGTENDNNGKIKVVTTIFPYYDFVRQIAGDRAQIRLVVPAGMDTHSFEPTAEDMIAISEADIFIYNGGSMESWVSRVLSASDVGSLRVEAMMEQVDVLEEETVEGMSGSEKGHHNHGDEEEDGADNEAMSHEKAEHGGAEIDEHVWTSPPNAVRIVRYILNVLVGQDPSNGDYYTKNANSYIEKLNELDRQISEVVSKSKRKTLVFADRFPLRYFTEEYNLEYSAAFAGCSADIEPSADTIAFLIDKVKDEDIPAVLKIELTSRRVADVIAETADVKVLTFYTCHNVTAEQFKQGATYVSLMENNIDVLRQALY